MNFVKTRIGDALNVFRRVIHQTLLKAHKMLDMCGTLPLFQDIMTLSDVFWELKCISLLILYNKKGMKCSFFLVPIVQSNNVFWFVLKLEWCFNPLFLIFWQLGFLFIRGMAVVYTSCLPGFKHWAPFSLLYSLGKLRKVIDNMFYKREIINTWSR